MIKVYNNIEDLSIFEGNDLDFIEFTKEIAKENFDFKTNIRNSDDAKNYINEYCDNLEIKQ